MDLHFLLFAGIVLLAFTTLAMTGFGSIVISVALGAHLYPIDELVPLLVPLDLLLTGSVALRNVSGVDWPLLTRKIGPAMVLGLIAGMAAARAAPGDALRTAFGALLVLLSARELYTMLGPSAGGPRPISRPAFALWLGVAGLIHGIWASGGPPLVYAVSRLGIAKGAFRATLAVLWFAMDAILLANYVSQGVYGRATLGRIALLLPLIPLSLWAGEKLHRRVSERRFRIVIFSVLLFAGAGLVLR